MEKLLLKDIQNIERDILKYIHDICEKNNLRYFLAYGTLLGAVRHKDFIPWDDDIDIWVPRPDYEKLLEIIHSENGRYKVFDTRYDKKARLDFAKIYDSYTTCNEGANDIVFHSKGLWVDIFVLDGLGNDIKTAENVIKKVRRIQLFHMYSNTKLIPNLFKTNILKWPFKICLFICNKVYIRLKTLKKILEKEYKNTKDYDNSKYVGFLHCMLKLKYDKLILKKEYFDDYILMNFGENKFRVPIGYDELLKKTYGEYMIIPDKKDRVCHNVDAWIINENYYK